jgi:hypothetical protein
VNSKLNVIRLEAMVLSRRLSVRVSGSLSLFAMLFVSVLMDFV